MTLVTDIINGVGRQVSVDQHEDSLDKAFYHGSLAVEVTIQVFLRTTNTLKAVDEVEIAKKIGQIGA